MSRTTPSSIEHDTSADDVGTHSPSHATDPAAETGTPDARAAQDSELSWWCVTNERLFAAAGVLGWFLLAAAFVAAATQRTALTVLSLLLLAVVGVESSPWRGTRARVALAVAAQVIAVVFLAGRL